MNPLNRSGNLDFLIGGSFAPALMLNLLWIKVIFFAGDKQRLHTDQTGLWLYKEMHNGDSENTKGRYREDIGKLKAESLKLKALKRKA
jgi:hypothetical protein